MRNSCVLRFCGLLVFGILVMGSCYGKTTIGGKPYYSLPEVADMLGMKFRWVVSGVKGELTRGGAVVKLQKEKRFCEINDVQVWLGDPVCLRRNQLFVSEKDIKGSIGPVLTSKHLSKQRKLRHIILDPGHGGKDQGTSNKKYGMHEKDLALDLAFRMQDILEKQGYKVSMTRKKDEFIVLKERPKFAERWGGDLFVSLHFNSVAKGKHLVKGAETYVLTMQNHPSTSSGKVTMHDRKMFEGNKFDGNNALLGYCMQNSLCKNLKVHDRGVKRARFAVLKGLTCPGVLVEAGFLSNDAECEKIRSPVYREKMAKCIAKGIVDYDRVMARAKG